MPWSTWSPFWQIVVWIVIAIVAVYLFQNIILPLLGQIT